MLLTNKQTNADENITLAEVMVVSEEQPFLAR